MAWRDSTRELAWAAGFFDGEGSTGASAGSKPGSLRIFASVGQGSGRNPVSPPVLARFHRAVGGLGRIGRPYYDKRSGTFLYQWRSDNFEEVQAVVALLWGHLGEVKRWQAAAALGEYLGQYKTAPWRYRRPKEPRRLALTRSGARAEQTEEGLAWAAGLFDGEGSTELQRRWWRDRPFFALRSKVSQCDSRGVPEVLERFRSVVRHGWVEGPSSGVGYRNAYKWAAGANETVAVLELLWPALGVTKRAQAIAVLKLVNGHALLRRQAWRLAAATFVDAHQVERTGEPPDGVRDVA